jgi:hypothetical protein
MLAWSCGDIRAAFFASRQVSADAGLNVTISRPAGTTVSPVGQMGVESWGIQAASCQKAISNWRGSAGPVAVSGLAKTPISSIINAQMTMSQTGRSETRDLGGTIISAEDEIGRAVDIVNSCLRSKDSARFSICKID